MQDLIHKQLRKPLESLSPYFRYTQQLYFEHPTDQLLDLHITGAHSPLPGQVLLAYRIESSFLMLVQYPVSTQPARQLNLTYQFLQLPQEDMALQECTFHLNSLQLRQTGKVKEELLLLVAGKGYSAVRVLDWAELLGSEYSCQRVMHLDAQTSSVKFG
jgi:hypothetical protein